ncbi:phosphatidate cytidylyltransferase [Streptomyces sp. NPDC026206]|uniref:phosphatidate cytidylyltransferase n=1 Tax=Streptomyces sp. NPDC026206 TaxID=3157089 RepID=UPI0033C41379
MSVLYATDVLPRVVPVVAGALGVGGAVVAVLPARVGARRKLRRRWLAWLLAAALFLGALHLSVPGGALLALALGLVAVREYVRTAGLGPGEHTALAVAAAVLPVLSLEVYVSEAPLAFCLRPLALLLFAGVLSALVSGDRSRGAERAARTVFGLLWIPVALSGLVVLDGTAVAVGVAVAFGGIGARCGDTVLARLGGTLARPLSPLDPARTWAGVIGAGMAVAAALGAAGAFTLTLWAAVLCGCVLGDLLASMIGREADGSHTDSRLPGPGGLLDRVGSLLTALLLAMAVTL